MGDPLQSHWVTVNGKHILIGGAGKPDFSAPKTFQSADEGNKWGEKNMNGDELTAEEETALDTYQGGDKSMSSRVRSGKSIPASLKAALDSAISKFTVPQNVTTWRAANASFYSYLKRGSVFSDKGWTSTTLSKSFGKVMGENYPHPALLEFSVPKGFHAAFLGTRNDEFRHESELLFPRNTKWKVTRRRKEGRTLYIKLEPKL